MERFVVEAQFTLYFPASSAFMVFLINFFWQIPSELPEPNTEAKGILEAAAGAMQCQ